MDATIPPNPRETVGTLMGRAFRHWRASLDERLGPLGLTQARWLILIHLSRAGGTMPQRELPERIGVEGPTVVRVLDALERLGLIERSGCSGDRRAKDVSLTGQALEIISDINQIADKLREEVLAGISDEDLAVCHRVVSAMLRNLDVR